MTDLANISLPPDAPIVRALESMVENSRQIILVVGPQGRLLGTVTDGDIRRGLLRQVSLDQPLSSIMNNCPATVPPSASREVCLRIMREKDFRHLPVVDGDGRVVDLVLLTELVKSGKRDNWIVILAGGKGSRLRPLTDLQPKPLISVGGRPLLETILEAFAQQGFHRFFVSVNYKASMIEDHFKDGSQYGVSIEYLHEDRPLGTAGPLGRLPGRPTQPLVVMNGDLLTSVDFGRFLDFHTDQKSEATMCVREYDLEVPFGVAETDGVRLTGNSEKPVHRFFVNAGIYLLHPNAVDLVPEGEAYDMPALFQRMIDEGHKVLAYPIREYWLDVGRLDDLERAQRDFSQIFS